MEQLKRTQCLADFVFLQMPDEMPVTRRRECVDFWQRLLDTAFAKKRLTRVESLSHHVGQMELGHRHERDVLFVSPRPVRGGGDAAENSFQTDFDRTHTRFLIALTP